MYQNIQQLGVWLQKHAHKHKKKKQLVSSEDYDFASSHLCVLSIMHIACSTIRHEANTLELVKAIIVYQIVKLNWVSFKGVEHLNKPATQLTTNINCTRYYRSWSYFAIAHEIIPELHSNPWLVITYITVKFARITHNNQRTAQGFVSSKDYKLVGVVWSCWQHGFLISLHYIIYFWL